MAAKFKAQTNVATIAQLLLCQPLTTSHQKTPKINWYEFQLTMNNEREGADSTSSVSNIVEVAHFVNHYNVGSERNVVERNYNLRHIKNGYLRREAQESYKRLLTIVKTIILLSDNIRLIEGLGP